MNLSPRWIALILAFFITALTVTFLNFVPGTRLEMLVVAGASCFISTFLVTWYAIDVLIFQEVNQIYSFVKKLKIKDFNIKKKSLFKSENPLKLLNSEISDYVSEKQKEIDELKKLEAFRREFIADVSHELKTPIFAAQGFVHTLLDGAVNDKTVRTKFLKKAAKSLDGLDMLVQDLLTLSHIETGQIKMHFETIDMHKLTEEVFEQFEEKGEKRNIKLRVEGAHHKALVYADWQRISQVMTNLISNAIKHSNDGSDVVVSFDIHKKNVVTKVRDFGEGIPAEHQVRIFERFYRVDKSRSREKGGTGLGLAIVKHILDGHNTKAEVESEPGKGSTFSFKLPRVKPEAAEHHQAD